MEMTNPPTNNQTNAQGSFGAMLQQARKTKQLSLEEVASELFILKRHLQALEDENFTDLPQAAFARGFAINYAKLLGLDSVRVAASFDAAYPNELKPRTVNNIQSPLRPMGTLQRDSHSRMRFNPLLIVSVIALIILAIFLFRMVSNASKDNQAPEPVIEDITASEQAQGAAVNNQMNGVGASGSALNLNSTSGMSNTTLDVNITDNATVNITDSSGSSLMTGSQTRGDYKLLGTPPFNIQIDNVNNVSLLLNQESVALDQYTTGKQASFTLTP
jgi:cytoskeleton protein RodZ